jgi:type III secretion protein R
MAKLLPLLCLLDLSSSATRYLATALPNPVVMVIVLGALALAPFVLIMLTSFVKISVVLAILRNALGTQSVPPNQVITGLAFILSMFIMTPVVRNMYHEAGAIANTRDIFSESSIKNLFDAADKGKEPLRRFLAKHAHDADRMLFVGLARRLEEAPNQGGTGTPSPTPPMTQSTPVPAPTSESVVGKADTLPIPQKTQDQHEAKGEDNSRDRPGKDDFQVLIPAFVTSELQEAFRIGFLVFLPFIIIDMVVANILLAMGMSMLSPSVVSLPFKLLLFVLVNGWFLIVRNLVLSYV